MQTLDRISVLGIVKDVVLCKPEEAGLDDLGEGDFGSYAAERNTIFLNEKKNTSASRARDIIVHEVTHALIGDTGALFYLREQTGLSGEAYDRFEENLVAYLAPALASCLGDLSRVCDLKRLAKQVGSK